MGACAKKCEFRTQQVMMSRGCSYSEGITKLFSPLDPPAQRIESESPHRHPQLAVEVVVGWGWGWLMRWRKEGGRKEGRKGDERR